MKINYYISNSQTFAMEDLHFESDKRYQPKHHLLDLLLDPNNYISKTRNIYLIDELRFKKHDSCWLESRLGLAGWYSDSDWFFAVLLFEDNSNAAQPRLRIGSCYESVLNPNASLVLGEVWDWDHCTDILYEILRIAKHCSIVEANFKPEIYQFAYIFQLRLFLL